MHMFCYTTINISFHKYVVLLCYWFEEWAAIVYNVCVRMRACVHAYVCVCVSVSIIHSTCDEQQVKQKKKWKLINNVWC